MLGACFFGSQTESPVVACIFYFDVALAPAWSMALPRLSFFLLLWYQNLRRLLLIQVLIAVSVYLLIILSLLEFFKSQNVTDSSKDGQEISKLENSDVAQLVDRDKQVED